jgi:hypothetical protein
MVAGLLVRRPVRNRVRSDEPMRAVVMSQHFGGALYGRPMGLQVTMLALATAGGPFLAGQL